MKKTHELSIGIGSLLIAGSMLTSCSNDKEEIESVINTTKAGTGYVMSGGITGNTFDNWLAEYTETQGNVGAGFIWKPDKKLGERRYND